VLHLKLHSVLVAILDPSV